MYRPAPYEFCLFTDIIDPERHESIHKARAAFKCSVSNIFFDGETRDGLIDDKSRYHGQAGILLKLEAPPGRQQVQ